MAAVKILLDTNVLFKEGQLAQLLKLRDQGVAKLHVSSITFEKEYPNMFKTAWEGKNSQMLKDMRSAGMPKEKETELMNRDRLAMDKIIMRFDILDVSESEGDKYKHMFKDPSDAFLVAAAQKHGINRIVSADTSAVDPKNLAPLKMSWETPNQFLTRLTENFPMQMSSVFRREKSFPPSLSDFENQLADARANLSQGMVFVREHSSSGGPVRSFWRMPPSAVA